MHPREYELKHFFQEKNKDRSHLKNICYSRGRVRFDILGVVIDEPRLSILKLTTKDFSQSIAYMKINFSIIFQFLRLLCQC